MNVEIYQDKVHKEFCVVFYKGDSFVLYANTHDDYDFRGTIELIKTGLDNMTLISLDTKSFEERKEFLYSIEVTE